MKRLMVTSFAMLAVLAFAAAPHVAAGEGCYAAKNTSNTMTSSKGCALGAKQVNSACSAEEKAACASKLGLSVEDCEMYCTANGYEIVQIAVDGMTCSGCENSIKSTLAKVDGVAKVGKVSYMEGSAVVVVNSKTVGCTSHLIKAVTDKGYKAEIIPAVATSADAPTAKKVNASKMGCSAACSLTCGSKKMTTAESKKKTNGSN